MENSLGLWLMLIICVFILIRTFIQDKRLKTFKERNILSKSLSMRVYIITLVGIFIAIYLIIKRC